MVVKKSYKFYETLEYQEWLEKETYKAQLQIADRLSNITLHAHFGDHKSLGEELWELKWTNGRRLYYAYLAELNIIILLGGNKNGQSKDINKAKRIFKKYCE